MPSWATEDEAKQHAAAFLSTLSKRTGIPVLGEKEAALLQVDDARSAG